MSGAMVRVLAQRGVGFEQFEGEDDDRRVPATTTTTTTVARDEWSDVATRALLASWGERHLRLARGGLKLCDWAEVAKIVSSCSSSPKTGVQCKNRVDTLKKKFKSERQKQLVSAGRSKWPFYAALERLLSMARDKDEQLRRPQQQHEQDVGLFDDRELARNHRGLETEEAELASSSMDNASSWEERRKSKKAKLEPCRKRKQLETEEDEEKDEEDEEEDEAVHIKELSDAIARFGEIYERFERCKQQQMAELERARMEFVRDLELHRMQLLMQAQMEVARLKHLQQQDEENDEDQDASGSVLAGINLERTTTNF